MASRGVYQCFGRAIPLHARYLPATCWFKPGWWLAIQSSSCGAYQQKPTNTGQVRVRPDERTGPSLRRARGDSPALQLPSDRSYVRIVM